MMGRTSRYGIAGILVVAGLALAAAVAALVAAAGAFVVWLTLRHPCCLVGLCVSVAVLVGGGPLAVVGLWSLVAVGALAWRRYRRASFDRRVLRRWRRTFVYGWRWRRAMIACDLDRPGRWGRQVPRLGAVWSTRWTDTVSVHPLAGQDAASFAARADELAWMFGALACAARPDAAGVVRLEPRRGDPLARPVPVLPIPERPDLDALRLGIRDDGAPWTVSLRQGHLLVVGGTESGNRSVVWSLIRALAAPVRDGTVELWGVGGAGRLALGVGEAMFARLALGGPADGAAVLDAATALLRDRAGRHGGRPPGDVPTVDDPPVVLVLDEVVRWGPVLDDGLRRRLAAALELLLAHGRDTGIVVVATTPVADTAVACRFPQRVILHPVAPPSRGAPGVGFATAGREAPVRVRAARLGEGEIAAMAASFAAPVRTVRAPPSHPGDGLALQA
jgi:S-DNA-T family DNA segregation ATPase FtsK/SpoIIIE